MSLDMPGEGVSRGRRSRPERHWADVSEASGLGIHAVNGGRVGNLPYIWDPVRMQQEESVRPAYFWGERICEENGHYRPDRGAGLVCRRFHCIARDSGGRNGKLAAI